MRYTTDGAPELVISGKAIRFIDRRTNWRYKPAGAPKPEDLSGDGLIGCIILHGALKQVKHGKKW